MFNGFYTSGDEMVDKILYTALAVLIISFIIIFGAPLFNKVLASMF